MDRQGITRVLEKYGCEPISAQTVPGTFAFITYSSLCAEQVNNRSSAQWKKANFIVCSSDKRFDYKIALEGWKLLAESTRNQILFIQGKDGLFRSFNWSGKELYDTITQIVNKYRL